MGATVFALCLIQFLFYLSSPSKWIKAALSYSSRRSQSTSSGKLPDWRVVTDCSAYDLSGAPMKLTQGTYTQCPFQFPSKFEDDYDWKNLTAVPELWMKSLNATAPKEPINETFMTADILPHMVSKEDYEACVQRMKSTTYEEQQLDHVLKQVKRRHGRLHDGRL
jgi:hypothetical protein